MSKVCALLYVLYLLFVISNAFPASQERIVNGTQAELGEFPYMVAVLFYDNIRCGGSIIDATHILTAAHCVFGMTDPSRLTIKYGVLNWLDDRNTIRVREFVIHDDFLWDTALHDIAILTLADPIKFNEFVQPTKLPKQGDATPAQVPSALCGWGQDKTGGDTSDILMKVDLTVYSDDECERLNPKADRRYNLCAGFPPGGKGQCNGDSGGPLYANGVQVGIVSWSTKPCASVGNPGVFAKVSNYIDWINTQLYTN